MRSCLLWLRLYPSELTIPNEEALANALVPEPRLAKHVTVACVASVLARFLSGGLRINDAVFDPTKSWSEANWVVANVSATNCCTGRQDTYRI